jgi:hypothetical protein
MTVIEDPGLRDIIYKSAWRLSKNGTVCAALPDLSACVPAQAGDWFTRSAGVIRLGSLCQQAVEPLTTRSERLVVWDGRPARGGPIPICNPISSSQYPHCTAGLTQPDRQRIVLDSDHLQLQSWRYVVVLDALEANSKERRNRHIPALVSTT